MNNIDRLIEAVEAGPSDRQGLLHMIDKAMPQDGRGCMAMAHQAYEGSLDAALALHEALLPGWRMDALWQGGTLCRNENDWSCRLRCVSEKRRAIENDEREALPTPARAWLLAILRAYRSVQA